MKSGELLEAAEEGDVQGVENIISELLSDDVEKLGEETAKQIDDADSDGKTSLMAAARGAGSGGEHYASILELLWDGHKKCGTSKQCLETKDSKRQWNVFMHSAKCGDAKNLNIVFDMYTEVFGTLSTLKDDTDWVNVDFKVKKLVSEKVFSGNADPISNYNYGSRRRIKKRSSDSNSRPATLSKSTRRKQASKQTKDGSSSGDAMTTATDRSVATTATANTTDVASVIPQASQLAAIPNASYQKPISVAPSPATDRASAPSTVVAAMIPQASLPSATIRASSPATNQDVANPVTEIKIEKKTNEEDATVLEGDQFDTYSQATNQPTTTVAGSNELTVCRQELKRSQEENKRLASEITKLKQAIRVLTG